jgi:hypothetical protein
MESIRYLFLEESIGYCDVCFEDMILLKKLTCNHLLCTECFSQVNLCPFCRKSFDSHDEDSHDEDNSMAIFPQSLLSWNLRNFMRDNTISGRSIMIPRPAYMGLRPDFIYISPRPSINERISEIRNMIEEIVRSSAIHLIETNSSEIPFPRPISTFGHMQNLCAEIIIGMRDTYSSPRPTTVERVQRKFVERIDISYRSCFESVVDGENNILSNC